MFTKIVVLQWVSRCIVTEQLTICMVIKQIVFCFMYVHALLMSDKVKADTIYVGTYMNGLTQALRYNVKGMGLKSKWTSFLCSSNRVSM